MQHRRIISGSLLLLLQLKAPQAERELRDEYLASMGTLADGLTKKNHELAIAIASIPDDIRGYGHVKDASVEAAKAREAELWQNWPAGGLPAKKQTLIAAE